MKARAILERKGTDWYGIAPDASVHEAVKMLSKRRIGALLVVAEGQLQGIVSERDIMNCCSKCAHAADCHGTVSDIMTREVVTAGPDADLLEVMETMRKSHIRHLPIVAEGRIEGVVSMRDVVGMLLDETTFENKRLVEYITGKYPA